MANIAIPTTFTASTVAKSAEVNANFSEVATKFNTYAVQTDVAKTITVSHTQAADLLFTDNLYDIGKSGANRPRNLFLTGTILAVNSITSQEGFALTGLGVYAAGKMYRNATLGLVVAGVTSATSDLTLLTGGGTIAASILTSGVLVSAFGITVAAGGITITGNSTITGTLGGLTGLTIASGGLTVTLGGASITGAVTMSSTLTVAGGFGCNTKAAQGSVSVPVLTGYAAGANGLATGAQMQNLYDVVTQCRAALVANGILV